jgi:hypothetical protein
MFDDLKHLIARADGLAGDVLGAVSLMVILMGGLHLPVLF